MSRIRTAVLLIVLALDTVFSQKLTTTTTQKPVETTTSTKATKWTSSTARSITSSSTISVPINSQCLLLDDKCVYNGTNVECDPCHGFTCHNSTKCVSSRTTCTAKCECTDQLQHLVNNVCVGVCDPNPCNDNSCTPTLDEEKKYRCGCRKDYTGEHCEKWYNYCLDPSPALCPKGPFDCEMIGPGNYTCGCADGYYHNATDNCCLKVGQQLQLSLVFKDSFYDERYNSHESNHFKNASKVIERTFSDVFDSLLIGLEYGRFSEGSLVANLTVELRVPESGYPEDNVNAFKKYLVNCESREWKNDRSKVCFGDLGRAFLPMDGANSTDLRCVGVFCPASTVCAFSTLSNLKNSNPICVCDKGYETVGVVTDHLGRVIERCGDIDECSPPYSNPCDNGTVCSNTIGGYRCITTPCQSNPCPGNAVCISDSENFYTCECSWIYSADGCTSPWPLAMLILSIVLIILLILLIIFIILRSMRNNTGTYRVHQILPKSLYANTWC